MATTMKGRAVPRRDDDDPRQPVRLGEYEAPSLDAPGCNCKASAVDANSGLCTKCGARHRAARPLEGARRWALGVGDVLDCPELAAPAPVIGTPTTKASVRPDKDTRLDREVRRMVQRTWRSRATGCSQHDREDLEQNALLHLRESRAELFAEDPTDEHVRRACAWARKYSERQIADLLCGVHRGSRGGGGILGGLHQHGRLTTGGRHDADETDEQVDCAPKRHRRMRGVGGTRDAGYERARRIEDARIQLIDASRPRRPWLDLIELVEFWSAAGECAGREFRDAVGVSPSEFADPWWPSLLTLASDTKLARCPRSNARRLDLRQEFVACVDGRSWAGFAPGELKHTAMTRLWVATLATGIVDRLQRSSGYVPPLQVAVGTTPKDFYKRELDAIKKARAPGRLGVEYVTVIDGIEADGTLRTHEGRVRPGARLFERGALAVLPGREADLLDALRLARGETVGPAVVQEEIVEVSPVPAGRSGLISQSSPSAGA